MSSTISLFILHIITGEIDFQVTGVTIFLIGASLITAGIQNWGGEALTAYSQRAIDTYKQADICSWAAWGCTGDFLLQAVRHLILPRALEYQLHPMSC